MTTTTTPAVPDAKGASPLPPSDPAASPGRRVASVDMLRGLVMFTMLFVNDVAGVRAAPAWMRHVHPSTADGMTFVDLVFPAFLFLVGMAIPLSLRGRIARGEPAWKLTLHIVTRALSLLLIGILMVNMPADAAAVGWPGHLWEVLTFTAVLLAFHAVPRPTPLARRTSLAARATGFAAPARCPAPASPPWRSPRPDDGRLPRPSRVGSSPCPPTPRVTNRNQLGYPRPVVSAQARAPTTEVGHLDQQS